MEELLPFYQNKRVLGLAEMMNSYGVLQNAPDCIEKLRKTQEYENKSMVTHRDYLVRA